MGPAFAGTTAETTSIVSSFKLHSRMTVHHILGADVAGDEALLLVEREIVGGLRT